MKIVVALLMIITASGVAAAQINKCLDKSGKVVGYGTECPAGSRVEQMPNQGAPTPASAPAGAPTAAPGQKSLADRDADFRKRQVEKQEAETKAQKKSAETAQRKQACENSQAYVKTLQAGQRVVRTDPKTGERAYLTDKEYAGELAQAQRTADANCK